MEERGREDPFVRVSQGERGSLTPHQPLGSPFPAWTEGGLDHSVLSYRESPASQLGLLLGSDSRAETRPPPPPSAIRGQRAFPQPPAHNGGGGRGGGALK